MGLIKKILFVVLLVLILGGFFAYRAVTKVSVVNAQIHVKAGTVLVDGKPVADVVKVKEGNLIETAADGVATVVLYESILIELAENTAIRVVDLVKEHPKVEQVKGSTWNRFTKLFGVQGYSINAGNSVASVRGTAFEFTDGKVIVGEGEVEYTVDGKTIIVAAGNVAEMVNGELVQRPATAEEVALIKKRTRGNVEDLKQLRAQELEKNAVVVDKAKEQFGVTDSQIEDALNNADAGNVNLDEVMQQYREKVPVEIGALTKVVDLTKKIQELNRETNGEAAAQA